MLRYFQRWILGGFMEHKGLINQLNGKWSPILLFVLFIVSALFQFIEKPVNCWCPEPFTQSMVEYTHEVCRKKDFVYFPIEQIIPYRPAEVFPVNISWNRWIPFIFLIQAVLFLIPRILLHVGESKLGYKRNALYGLSDGYTKLSIEDRTTMARQLSRLLNQWLKNRILSGLPFGFLSLMVIFVYLLYVINVSVQLSFMDNYLKHPNATSYADHIASNIFANETDYLLESPVLYKKFLCDFSIRQIANLQHYTIQCMNIINMRYEQMAAFLWIWLVFTAVVTYCSFVLKVLELLLPFMRTRYVRQYIQSENVQIRNQSDVSRLANSVLGEDGVMVLKAIGEMSSEHLVRDAVVNLWYINFGQRNVPLQQVASAPPEQANYQHAYPYNVNQSTSHDSGAKREENLPLIQMKEQN